LYISYFTSNVYKLFYFLFFVKLLELNSLYKFFSFSFFLLYTFYIIGSSAIANLLDVEAPQNNALNEKMAINAIQKSLMLCETAVNPTSSTITIPGTPPAYSTAVRNVLSDKIVKVDEIIELLYYSVL